MIRKYLLFLGLDPYQENMFSKCIMCFMVCSALGVVIPTLMTNDNISMIRQFIEVYISISKSDFDTMFESLPYLLAAAISIVKILNVHLKKRIFRKLMNMVVEEWESLKLTDDLYPLEETTKRASNLASLYRTSLLSFLVLFLSLPFIPYVLDIVSPLNETRPHQQLVQVEYLFFEIDDHFMTANAQLSWCVAVVVITVVTVDSLYIIIIHHASGMFAVCGHQMQKVTETVNANGATSVKKQLTQFKRCLSTHNRAIEFYEILRDNSTNNYLFQVGLNMVGISVTAVQFVLSLDRPSEAIKATVLLTSKQFHLFVLSLPGQVLLDYCSALAINIYCSKWYKTPLKIQRMIQMMQIRSNRPCELTAGGLYVLGIENFGSTLKTCMSFVTMMLSVKE